MTGRLTEAIRHLAADDPASDSDLLGAFVRSQDPAAFAALVRRHGPMVLGVCRRVRAGRRRPQDGRIDLREVTPANG